MTKPAFVALALPDFRAWEFGGSLPFLSFSLLAKLQEFRSALGGPVVISPAPGSLMRFGGGESSQHAYGRAADIMLPEGPGLAEAARIAAAVGFTGIGIYPDWRPYPGLHLDVRPGRDGNPATWAGLRRGGEQVYVSLSEGLTVAAEKGA